MLKKLALVVILGINTIQAAETPKAGFIQRIKNSPALVKWTGGIIPFLATGISMEALRRTYKDNPEKSTLVKIVTGIECIALLIAVTFYDWWFRIDFKKWICSPSTKKLTNLDEVSPVVLSPTK